MDRNFQEIKINIENIKFNSYKTLNTCCNFNGLDAN